MIGLNHEDWVSETSGIVKKKIFFRGAPKKDTSDVIENGRIECIRIISKMSPEKLKLTLEILSNIA